MLYYEAQDGAISATQHVRYTKGKSPYLDVLTAGVVRVQGKGKDARELKLSSSQAFVGDVNAKQLNELVWSQLEANGLSWRTSKRGAVFP